MGLTFPVTPGIFALHHYSSKTFILFADFTPIVKLLEIAGKKFLFFHKEILPYETLLST